MANSDKNIIITPYVSGITQPQMTFVGQGNDPIYLKVLDGITGTGATAGGALSIEGSAGQLFSVVNRLGTGSIFSVNDISGFPIIDVNANGTLSLAPSFGNVGVGLTGPTNKFQVTGNAYVSGLVTAVSGISAAGATFSGLIRANAGISASGGTFGPNGLNTSGAMIAGGAVESGFNWWIRGPQWLDPNGLRVRTVYNWGDGSPYSIDFKVSATGATDETTRFNISATGVSGGTAFFSGLLNASAGISASGGVTFAGTVSSDTGYRISSSAFNTQTGTTYTFIAADNGEIVTFDNGSTITVTVPTGLPVGFNCTAIQLGTGSVGFTAASGVTLNAYSSAYKIAGQHGSASLISYSTNVFNLSGSLNP